jgi:broad specificity phosphatase PhoE
MKIIIVKCCHSVCSDDCMATLSYNGFEEADELIGKLNNYKFDEIYCSPYLRTLQSIFPYCNAQGKDNLVNLEYSLLPKNKIDIDDKATMFVNCYTDIKEYFNYITPILNTKYETSVYPTNVKINETIGDIENRLHPFLYNLRNKHYITNKTILIVTHDDIAQRISNYLKDTGITIII